MIRALILCLLAGMSPALMADEYGTDLKLGIEHVKRGDGRQAIAVLTPLYSATDWEAAFWLGSAHLLSGEHEMARAYLDSALTVRGDIIDIWIQRAVVEQESARPEVAIELLRVAANLDAAHPLVQLNLGYALEQLGRGEEAMGAYRAYLQLAAGDRGHVGHTTAIMSRMQALAAAR
jgi:Flp pilus assembly protein TadD